MPTDHSSIASRHRARTIGRAKSLRKHQRWLAQYQSQAAQHQSQPDLLIFPESQDDEQSQGTSTLSRSPASEIEQKYCFISPFPSTRPAANPETPANPTLHSSFSWQEVNWHQPRRRLTFRGGLRPIFWPYRTDTTRHITTACEQCVPIISRSSVTASQQLKRTKLKYNHPKPKPVMVTKISEATIKLMPRYRTRPPEGVYLLVDPQFRGGEDSTSTASSTSSQASDPDGFINWYAIYAKPQFGTPPQEQKSRFETPHLQHSNANAEPETDGEREPRHLPPSPMIDRPVSRERQPSLQRYQRDRHPQLIFSNAPGHENFDIFKSSSAAGRPRPERKRSFKIRRLVNGTYHLISISLPSPIIALRRSLSSPAEERRPLLQPTVEDLNEDEEEPSRAETVVEATSATATNSEAAAVVGEKESSTLSAESVRSMAEALSNLGAGVGLGLGLDMGFGTPKKGDRTSPQAEDFWPAGPRRSLL
jgi:hypothetical protein